MGNRTRNVDVPRQIKCDFRNGAIVILNGWKEISRYLGCGVRTAQRWEICFGMPVIRPGRVQGKGAVIAHSDEIDSWQRQPRQPEQLRERIRELEIGE